MVGKVVLRNIKYLRRLAQTKSARVRETLIKNASEEQLLAILEVCLNVLRFRVRVSLPARRKLAHHAAQLRRLSRARTASSVRRILKSSSGSIFRPLLQPVLTQVGRVIN